MTRAHPFVWMAILAACGGSGTDNSLVDARTTDAPITGGDAAITDGPGVEPTTGLRGAYFARYFGPPIERIDHTIDFAWGDQKPIAGAGADLFAVRWTGTLTVPVAGTYGFSLDSDDGDRLWIGGARVIDAWKPGAHAPAWAEVDLAAGDAAIKVTYFDGDGDAHATLRWRRPDGTEEVIPETALHPAPSDPDARSPLPPYTNPVLDQGCADPGVLKDGDWYYLACTGGRFRIRRSRDLIHWTFTDARILPDGGPPWSSGTKYHWAPEMHRVGDHIVAYFTAADGTGQRAVGAAPAKEPLGPYTMQDGPLVTNPIGVIDPNFFHDKDGSNYLLWKVAGTSSGKPTPIFIRKLGPRGLGFAANSKAIELIRNDPDTWEGSTTEAPWLIERGGTYYLFYSGNFINERYRVGVARASSVTGPYEKLGTPILGNNKTWVGPGHIAIAQVDGLDYMIYHAWPTKADGTRDVSRGRLLLVDRIHWGDDGWPTIAKSGKPSTGLLPGPGIDPDADPSTSR